MRTPDCSLLYGGLSGVVPLMSGALAPLRRLHFDELPYLRKLMSKHFYSFSTCLHLVPGQAFLQLVDLRISNTPLLRLHWAPRAPCTATRERGAERPLLPCTPLPPLPLIPPLRQASATGRAWARGSAMRGGCGARWSGPAHVAVPGGP